MNEKEVPFPFDKALLNLKAKPFHCGLEGLKGRCEHLAFMVPAFSSAFVDGNAPFPTAVKPFVRV